MRRCPSCDQNIYYKNIKSIHNATKNNSLCKKCSQLLKESEKKSSKIEEIVQFILAKWSGKLLSVSYKDNKTALSFQCSVGHVFEKSWQAVKKDNLWCPECTGERIYRDIDFFKKLSIDRGGKCLSIEFFGQYQKLTFECFQKHVWDATPKSIMNGSWCPYCSSSLGENICRIYFETIFGKDFPRVRPDFLKGSHGYNYELDGYCEELGVAFEHQGRQHYQECSHLQRTRSLQETIIADNEKFLLCQNNNIKLIYIPELFYLTKLEDLQSLIKVSAGNFEIQLPTNYDLLVVDLKTAYTSDTNSSNLKKLHNSCRDLNIRCISPMFKSWLDKLDFVCNACNYAWSTLPRYIITKTTSCPKCSHCFWEIEDVKNFAQSKGGICLSSEYKNQYSIVDFKCRNNHNWSCPFDNVLNKGLWCPQCPISLEEINIEAAARGGKCLSTKYVKLDIPLEWECGAGHRFSLPYKIVRVRKNKWCDICSI